jgi:hypothetical protein
MDVVCRSECVGDTDGCPIIWPLAPAWIGGRRTRECHLSELSYGAEEFHSLNRPCLADEISENPTAFQYETGICKRRDIDRADGQPQIPPVSLQTADFFVSPQGDDKWSGRLAKPEGKNGPFATNPCRATGPAPCARSFDGVGVIGIQRSGRTVRST